MLDFLNLQPESFGLDVSTLSLKIAKLKKRGEHLRLVSFGEGDVSPGAIKEGDITDPEELAKNIKDSLGNVKGEKLKTNYVVASLPEKKAFFEVIQMPKLPKEDLRSAVIYEAENYIPMPIESMYLDFQVITPIQAQNHLDHLDVLVGAVPKDTVDPYLNCLKQAGLEPLALEVESLAISRALIKGGETTSPVLIIDFGATRTSFIIFSGRALRFTSSISVSSENFTEIIAKNLGIPSDEAEKLKRKYGLEEKIKMEIKKEDSAIKKERSKIFEALVPALVDLNQQIKKHLDYYHTHTSHEHLPNGNKEVSKIILCGGGANLKGLPEVLSQELNLPVEIGDPWANIPTQGKKTIISHEAAVEYTTAFGLALRTMKEKLYHD